MQDPFFRVNAGETVLCRLEWSFIGPECEEAGRWMKKLTDVRCFRPTQEEFTRNVGRWTKKQADAGRIHMKRRPADEEVGRRRKNLLETSAAG